VKVTFVYTDYFETQDLIEESQGRVYLGIGYLSAFLKQAGHRTELIHFTRPPERESFLEEVGGTEPDLVAFSATTLQFPKVRMLCSWMDGVLQMPKVCGGVHPTICPEEVVEVPGIDYVCVGEGEVTLLELCDSLESGRPTDGIAGLWGAGDGRTFSNPVRPLVRDLDELPFPDRSIFNKEKFAANQRTRLSVMASRGCPFECSYCCNHLQKSIYPNSRDYVRFRSPGNVVAEIKAALVNEPELDHVRFEDDILTLDRRWFREFAPLFKEKVGLPFICNARVDLLNEEMVSLMADAGCSAVAMGIESGNTWLRKKVLLRDMDDSKIERAFELCRSYGIPTVSLNMTGFPRETLSMALDTVKMNARVQPGLAQVTALCPFPKTSIYKVCEEEDMLGDASLDTLFSGRSQLELDSMTAAQVEMVCENFVLLMVAYRRIFRLPWPLARAAEKVTDLFLGSRLVPGRLRSRILERARARLDWKHFSGIDY
jgi:radical SAM superfamily enzyme YgiQ (UPF0313 family)